MAVSTTIYNLLFKRTSTYILTIVAGSFMVERGIDILGDTVFKTINKGKLWDDIKHNYE